MHGSVGSATFTAELRSRRITLHRTADNVAQKSCATFRAEFLAVSDFRNGSSGSAFTLPPQGANARLPFLYHRCGSEVCLSFNLLRRNPASKSLRRRLTDRTEGFARRGVAESVSDSVSLRTEFPTEGRAISSGKERRASAFLGPILFNFIRLGRLNFWLIRMRRLFTSPTISSLFSPQGIA